MLTRNNLLSIYVLDQDKALTFYTEVLGLRSRPKWTSARCGG
ncbi:VOC family protein [Leekyejoonella antrihumi]|nr:VOC family protein [Leekyejoonella antrihumi]